MYNLRSLQIIYLRALCILNFVRIALMLTVCTVTVCPHVGYIRTNFFLPLCIFIFVDMRMHFVPILAAMLVWTCIPEPTSNPLNER